jgi:hypothetical protein
MVDLAKNGVQRSFTWTSVCIVGHSDKGWAAAGYVPGSRLVIVDRMSHNAHLVQVLDIAAQSRVVGSLA